MRDHERRIDVAELDAAEQVGRVAVELGLSHAAGQALVEGGAERELVDEAAVDAGDRDRAELAAGKDRGAQGDRAVGLEAERLLCERAAQGDRLALGQLLRKYGPALYRAVLLPRLGSDAAAQDALAETYARVISWRSGVSITYAPRGSSSTLISSCGSRVGNSSANSQGLKLGSSVTVYRYSPGCSGASAPWPR